ncbi:MAG: S8 family serine peptidase [Chromatiaceae bacterium]|nr:S8 family serine peptidase [Chromatiaceae bacterium]
MRDQIDAAQSRLERRLRLPHRWVSRKFKRIPFLAMEVDQQALDDLLRDSEVASVEEDRIHFPLLASSSAVIGDDDLAARGFTGSGMAVAVLDSGVDTTHAFLNSAVVSEACFSTTYAPHNATSLCPDGSDEQIGTGAGINCNTGLSGCDHGTHVAGIAAGNGASGGTSYSGIARDANVIAIQVFSRFDDGSGPYIAAYTSDIVAGLSRVLELSEDPTLGAQIVAANLSLGGGFHTSAIACDNSNPSTKAVIDQLRAAGIATVVAAGNDSNATGMSAPGCISSAISVGATLDSDAVAGFSNSASWLSLFAPGVSIDSSVPGGGYARKSGTSMATPHVTGALAAVRAAALALRPGPLPTLEETLASLSNMGVPVADSRNGAVVPRIQLDAAIDTFDACLAPAANVIVDNAYVDVVGSMTSGGFTTASGTAYFRGTALQSNTAGVDSFRFTPALQSAGDYRISAWWAPDVANSDRATFGIRHQGGLDTVVVDQQADGGRWIDLGIYRLAGDGSDYVAVSDVDDPGSQVIADAVRFEFLQTPTLMVIDTMDLPDGVRGQPYDETLSATCAQNPVTWRPGHWKQPARRAGT